MVVAAVELVGPVEPVESVHALSEYFQAIDSPSVQESR